MAGFFQIVQVQIRERLILEDAHVGDVHPLFVGRQTDAERVAARGNVVAYFLGFGVDDQQPEADLIHGVKGAAVLGKHHITDVAVVVVDAVSLGGAFDGTRGFARGEVEEENLVRLAARHVHRLVVGRDGQAHKAGFQHTVVGLGLVGDLLDGGVVTQYVADNTDRNRIDAGVSRDRDAAIGANS